MSETDQPLQHFRGGTLVNRTTFGRDLRRMARDTMVHMVKTYEHGYQDGGCLTFAKALADWSGGQITLKAVVRTDRPGKVQHAFAAFANLCMDSDGVGTQADMIEKYVQFELVPASLLRIKPMTFETYKGAIPFYPELRDYLVARLTKRFGGFDPQLLARP